MGKNYEVQRIIEEHNNDGKEAEAEGDLELAANHYEESVKKNYADSFSFSRLMIIYRKLKKPAEELRVLKKGIKIFTEQHENRFAGRKNKKISDLSDAFMTKAGLKDKKGKHTFYPEPISKWTKRKELIEAKLKKKTVLKK